MISTRIDLGIALAALAGLAGCDRSSSPNSATGPLVPTGRTQTTRVETPSEKSYRLLPKIVRSGTRTNLAPPLLRVDEKLGFGIELVLRKPGESRAPTASELAAIEALGTPIPKILARNLSRYLTDPPPELDVMQGTGGEKSRIYRLIIDFPGRESLILLPQLWTRFAEQDHRKICMALPMRTRLLILPRDDKKLLRELAPTLAQEYHESGDPICDRYIFLEDGKLVAGPSFASLAKH